MLTGVVSNGPKNIYSHRANASAVAMTMTTMTGTISIMGNLTIRHAPNSLRQRANDQRQRNTGVVKISADFKVGGRTTSIFDGQL
ncbi:MAG: hypothetical protein WBW99_15725 [Pseudolabrys sp.]